MNDTIDRAARAAGSALPGAEVTAAGAAGAVATLAAWGLTEFAGVQVPPGVEAAFAVLGVVIVRTLKARRAAGERS